mmetsp:Transcript_5683/g.7631  ORF Transcript_5683/g.7631 Transcript_5683/m.7631 type:complete len:125 (-) Transcript_5683:1033-1407(-)
MEHADAGRQIQITISHKISAKVVSRFSVDGMRLGAMLDVPVGSTLRTFMQTSQTLTATLTQTYMCICQKPPTIDNFQLLLSCPTCHSTFTGTFILFVPEAVLYPTMTRSNSSMWMKNATELKGA